MSKSQTTERGIRDLDLDLHRAVRLGCRKRALDLIRRGANPNASFYRNWTPLHVAAAFNRYDIVRDLLESGADAQAKTRSGITPYDIARHEGYSRVRQLLGQERNASASVH